MARSDSAFDRKLAKDFIIRNDIADCHLLEADSDSFEKTNRFDRIISGYVVRQALDHCEDLLFRRHVTLA